MLVLLQEGPRASQSSLLAETIPETQDTSQTPDVTQSSDVSQDFEVIIPRKTPQSTYYLYYHTTLQQKA